jgi:hypothetical protein
MLPYIVGSQQGSRKYEVQLLELLASWSMCDVINDMRHFKHVNIIVNYSINEYFIVYGVLRCLNRFKTGSEVLYNVIFSKQLGIYLA